MRRCIIAVTSLLPFTATAAPESPAATPAAQAEPAPRQMGTLRVEGGPIGVPVFIDGEAAGITPLPGPWTLPAGKHTVELRPAGGSPIVREAEIETGREARVTLGAVTAARPAPTPPKPAAAATATDAAPGPAGPGFSLATAGYITAGVGVAAIGAGVALGLMADGYADDAFAVTPPAGTRAEQQALVDDADAAAFWANFAYGAGGVLVVGGVAMALLASDGPLGGGSVSLLPTAGGAAVAGSF